MGYLTVNNTIRHDSDIDALIFLIAEGDKYALESLYLETRAAVYGFALSIVRNVHTAEDVMYETYSKIFSTAQNYISNKKPMVWILIISRDLAKIKLQENYASDVSPEIELKNEEGNFQRALDHFVLKTTLSVLNEEERQIIMLHDVAGVKYSEAATILEIPFPMILPKYQLALIKLKRHLEEHI